jgi:hypothetical protein
MVSARPEPAAPRLLRPSAVSVTLRPATGSMGEAFLSAAIRPTEAAPAVPSSTAPAWRR